MIKEQKLIKKLIEEGQVESKISKAKTWELVRDIYSYYGELVYPHQNQLFLLRSEVHKSVLRCVRELDQTGYIERDRVQKAEHAIKGQIKANYLDIDIKEFLEGLLEKDLFWTIEELLTSDAVWSDLTQQYYWQYDPDLVWVYCKWGYRTIKEPCLKEEAEHLAFFCGCTERWYANRDYESIEIGEYTYLYEAVQNFIYRWRDGTYHWEPEVF